jgi:3-phenylpropionate/trans-cinnamate dioxygenase ferredoxin component
MDFVEVAKVEELTPGKMKGVTISSKDILIANIDGRLYAIGGKCTHAGGNLSKGEINGNIVTCPRHGSKFNVSTGKNVGGPAQKDEPMYQVKIEGNSIKVNI